MNLPNKLSLIRICLVPAFLIILYLDMEHAKEIAAAIFLLCAFTDLVDGYIARKTGTTTDFGKFIDPLADKILVISAMVYLVSVGVIPDWMAIIVVCRDFAISGIRMIGASKGEIIAASKLGKLKTGSQLFAVFFCIFQPWSDVIILDQPYYWWLMLVAVILTLISGIDYIWKNRTLISKTS